MAMSEYRKRQRRIMRKTCKQRGCKRTRETEGVLQRGWCREHIPPRDRWISCPGKHRCPKCDSKRTFSDCVSTSAYLQKFYCFNCTHEFRKKSEMAMTREEREILNGLTARMSAAMARHLPPA